MDITIERNQTIQSLQIIDNICVCVCVMTQQRKYKRNMCYHQKNNLDVKTFD